MPNDLTFSTKTKEERKLASDDSASKAQAEAAKKAEDENKILKETVEKLKEEIDELKKAKKSEAPAQ